MAVTFGAADAQRMTDKLQQAARHDRQHRSVVYMGYIINWCDLLADELVRRHLKGKEPVSKLAAEFRLQPSLIHNWVNQLTEETITQ